jgi:ABC-type transport system substrate-binding protein
MVPNPNWWGDEGPYLSQITFQFIPEAETVATMMLNDQIDTTIAGVSASIKEQLPDVFRPTKSIGFNNFWLRPSAEPTDDVNVRKALILAVDFEAVFPVTRLTLPGINMTRKLPKLRWPSLNMVAPKTCPKSASRPVATGRQ